MSAITPSAIDAMDMPEIKETNPSLFPLRLENVYLKPIIHSNGRDESGLFFTNLIQ